MIIPIPNAFATLPAKSWSKLNTLSRNAGLAPLVYFAHLLDEKFSEAMNVCPDGRMAQHAISYKTSPHTDR